MSDEMIAALEDAHNKRVRAEMQAEQLRGTLMQQASIMAAIAIAGDVTEVETTQSELQMYGQQWGVEIAPGKDGKVTISLIDVRKKGMSVIDGESDDDVNS